MMLSFAFAPNNQLVRGVQLAESLATQAEPVVVADKPILQPNQPDAFMSSASSVRAGTNLAFVEKKLEEWMAAETYNDELVILRELQQTRVCLENEQELSRVDE